MESTAHVHKRGLMDLSDTAILIGFGVQCGLVIASVAYLKAMFNDLKKTVNGMPAKLAALETDHDNLKDAVHEANREHRHDLEKIQGRVGNLELKIARTHA
jgi:hypothetical protein